MFITSLQGLVLTNVRETQPYLRGMSALKFGMWLVCFMGVDGLPRLKEVLLLEEVNEIASKSQMPIFDRILIC
eukprot:c2103_g2_i1 orf=232-450(+)